MNISILPILILIAFGLTTHVPSADSPAVADARDSSDERLASMRSMMKSYEIRREGGQPAAIKGLADPAFRIGRQKGNFLDGAIFLWLDEVGRPEAAVEAFLLGEDDAPNGKWIHEFTSLSTSPILASRGGKDRWHPTNPGLEFKPVPAAPKPAETSSQRLRQMRAIADGFRATDNFGDSGWENLRMLTTPIARYGKVGSTPEDGAMFAFVEGTDPEVFLFVELRHSSGNLEWQYSLAPMGCWAIRVEQDGREIWNVPRRSTGDPDRPLYSYQFWP